MRRPLAVLLLALLGSSAQAGDFICYLTVEDVFVPGVGWTPIVTSFYCTETIDVDANAPYVPYFPSGGGNGDPTDPPGDTGGSGGHEFPIVRIVSISDQNPGQPLLTVEYNRVVTRLELSVGGHSSTLLPPANVFFLPSLNHFAGGANIEVTAYDASGVFTRTNGYIRRSTSDSTNYNSFLLYYYTTSFGEIVDRLASYDRGVATKYVLTEYDVPTTGERNGRVFHEQTEDALYWNNSTLAPGTNPTPYPSAFVSRYVMHPAYIQGAPTEYFGSPCSPTGLTRRMFPFRYYPSTAAACDYPAEFAKHGMAGGVFDLAEIDGGDTLLSGTVIGGDRQLPVSP